VLAGSKLGSQLSPNSIFLLVTQLCPEPPYTWGVYMREQALPHEVLFLPEPALRFTGRI
jgi:hypothetical protein